MPAASTGAAPETSGAAPTFSPSAPSAPVEIFMPPAPVAEPTPMANLEQANQTNYAEIFAGKQTEQAPGEKAPPSRERDVETVAPAAAPETQTGQQPSSDARPTSGDGRAATPPAGLTPEQLSEFEAFRPLYEQLKQQGITSAADVQARLAAQQAETRQQATLQEKQSAVFQRLQAQIDAGDLTIAQADAAYERENALIEREAKADAILNQMVGQQRDLAISQALTAEKSPNLFAAGESGRALLATLSESVAAAQGKPHDPATVTQVGGWLEGILQQVAVRAVADHEAKRGQNAQVPVTVPGANGSAPPPPGGNKSPAETSWAEIFGASGWGKRSL